MYGVTPDMFLSVLRQILTIAGTFLAAKGWISSDVAAQAAGAIVVLVSTGFSMFFHSASNGVIPTVSVTSNALPNQDLHVDVTKTPAAVK